MVRRRQNHPGEFSGRDSDAKPLRGAVEEASLAMQIERALAREEHASLTLKHLLAVLKVDHADRIEVKRVLRELRSARRIVKVGTHYRLPSRRPATLEGIITIARDKYGFVSDPSGAKPDIFVPEPYTGGAMSGDVVEVLVEIGSDGRRSGHVVKILERKTSRIVGRFEPDRRWGYVIPFDRKLGFELLVTEFECDRPEPDAIVLAQIDSYPSSARVRPRGRVIEVLGSEHEPSIDIELACRAFELPREFDKKALEEARTKVRQFSIDTKGRLDLRSQDIFTIDGEDAKDFDDAVSIEKKGAGRWTLGVHVADVSEFVTEGSHLDVEARDRGNSVYFPGTVIPMVPSEISDDLGSLVPHKDRYTMSVWMEFDTSGVRHAVTIRPSVIRSVSRLTYTEVETYFESGGVSSALNPVQASIDEMKILAGILKKCRIERGSLDFGFPERQFVLDETGRATDVVVLGNSKARNLIEEFMIAANEAVASELIKAEIPLVFRVHETPSDERLQDLATFLSDLGLKVSAKDMKTPESLQRIFAELEAADTPPAVKMQVLRSMKQARYQEDRDGHFGLASRMYTHFTSPIRRYPDLLVHRLLKDAIGFSRLSGRRKSDLLKSLQDRAEHASLTERRAMEAERIVKNIKAARMMSASIGEVFSGSIAGLSNFGIFVTLEKPVVDGLIRLEELPPDRYHMVRDGLEMLGEIGGNRFTLGQSVRVRILETDIMRGEIVLALVDAGQTRTFSVRQPARVSSGRPERSTSSPGRTGISRRGSSPGESSRGGMSRGGGGRGGTSRGGGSRGGSSTGDSRGDSRSAGSHDRSPSRGSESGPRQSGSKPRKTRRRL